MLRNIKNIALVALIALAACETQKQVVEVPVQYKEKVVERLVPYAVAADSSALDALFKCDSLNNVVMLQLKEQKGRAQSKIDFQGGKLTYKLIREVDTIYVQAKDSLIYKEVAVKVEVPVEVNHLTLFQKLQISGFRIIAMALALFVAVRYLANPFLTTLKSLLKLK